MDFRPEKSNLRNSLLLILIFLDISLLLLFDFFPSMATRVGIGFLFLFSNGFAIYYIALLSTLKYRLTEDLLIISGAFNIKYIKIPIQEIESYSRSITLLNKYGNLGLSSNRFCIGRGHDNNGESAELFITSSRKAVFLHTTLGNFGISPGMADEFISRLRALGIPDRRTEKRASRSDFGMEKAAMNQLAIYSFILIGFLLFIPISLNLVGFMPELVEVSVLGLRGEYLTLIRYLETVMTRVLIAISITLFFYFSANLMSEILGKYYYQLMFISIALTSIFLLLEINTIIGILL